QHLYRQVAISHQGRFDLMHTAALAISQIGRLQAAGVVLVLSLALGVGRGFMGGLEGVPGDSEIGLQPVDDQRLEAGLVHGGSGVGLKQSILPEIFGHLSWLQKRQQPVECVPNMMMETKMLTVNLGPLTLAVPHLLLMISLLLATLTGWWVGRRHQQNPERQVFRLLLLALLVARLSFVV